MIFKPGDVVKLKSGGPVMTVRCVADVDAAFYALVPIGVNCDWIDDIGVSHRAAFVPEQLEYYGVNHDTKTA